MSAEPDGETNNDLYVLVSTFINGGSGAFRNIDPHSCRESYNLYSILKKHYIQLDNASDAIGVSLRKLLSGFPILVASALHRTSGKIAKIYGTLNDLPPCLAFPWAINMIPTTQLWEPLRVLWMMWKESYPSRILEDHCRAEYMSLNYVPPDALVFNREKLMKQFSIQPPSPDSVLRKIDVTLEKHGYGDNYAAFEIIFASYACDIWYFYEMHSRSYSFVDFSQCPEMMPEMDNAVPLNLSKSNCGSVSLRGSKSPSRDISQSTSEQQKPSGGCVTTVCFDEFKELKLLVDSLGNESGQRELKICVSPREARHSDDAGWSGSKPITENGSSNGVSTNNCRKETLEPNASTVQGVADALTACAEKELQNPVVQPNGVTNKSKDMRKLENNLEPSPSNAASWEYRILREVMMMKYNKTTREACSTAEIEAEQNGKRKRPAFQEDLSSRESLIRDIVHNYFIQNSPPKNFTSISPACIVFPEIPLLKSSRHRNAEFQPCENTSASHQTDVSDGSRCVKQNLKEMSSSSVSMIAKEEINRRDVFIKPRTPRRKKSQKEPVEVSVIQTHLKNFSTLGNSETNKREDVTMGLVKDNGCSTIPAVKTNGILTSSQNSRIKGDTRRKDTMNLSKWTYLNGYAKPQQMFDQPNYDSISEKNIVKTRCQKTKDCGQPYSKPLTITGVGDSLETNSTSRAFKPGCAGDVIDLEISRVPKELMLKHPESRDLKCDPQKANAAVDLRATSMEKEVTTKCLDVTDMASPPRSKIYNGKKAPFGIVNASSPGDGSDVAYLRTGTISTKPTVKSAASPNKKQTKQPEIDAQRSGKRLNNCDDPKRTCYKDGFLSTQASTSMTFSEWGAAPYSDDRQIKWAIKQFLPPPVKGTGRRNLSKQVLNVMRARGAWQWKKWDEETGHS